MDTPALPSHATAFLRSAFGVDGGVVSRPVALEDFGFGSLGLTPADFLEEGVVVQLGYPPKRIDILTQVAGVQFDSCWGRRVEVEIGGQRVPFLSADDLVANKKASGRPQDIADAAVIEEQLGNA